MFDIGFTELLVCLVVALVVIGPEQLPGTVRTVGLWIGRLKRSLRDTREEIERQIGADDIRRQLHNEEIMQNLEATRLRLEQTVREAEAAANNIEQPQTQKYGPPEELPDHAHMHDDVKPAPAAPVISATSNASPTTPASQTPTGTGH